MSHQLLTIRLSRQDATPWGFRLQGGKDFAQPLLIQKVNGGSLSEKAGLQVGDALIKVNNLDVYSLKHKEAQDALVKAGNDFTLTVERGPGATWKPQVQAVGTASPGGIHPVTKTSLAHNKPPASPIGSGHNLSPRPFANSPQQGGDSVKAIVNKQYNTPVNIYSEESIAETLSAQAEVLAGGVLGVNFKKNERSYNAGQSEVFKMVHEVDKEPREAEPDTGMNSVGLRHVAPPEPMRPPPSAPQQLPPGQNICADCERLIVGVFVRIKDKNLHVECFKCATCGTSLKNVGYYNINNKLYCDVHAKLVARQNPPAPNLVPVTVPPGGKIPSSVFTPNLNSTMNNASPASPQPGTIAPLPFHTPRHGTSHVSAPKFRPQGGPKPFGGNIGSVPPPAAPYSAPPPAAPYSAPAPAAPYSAPAPAPAPVPAPAAPAPTSFSTPSQQPQGYYTPTRPMSNIRGGGAGGKGAMAGTTAPRRGRGVLNPNTGPQARIPLCGHCNKQIRGPFITALGKIWCPEHFICVNAQCHRPLQDIGFVEEQEGLYCEFCFEKYLAPNCSKCNIKIKGDCLNAIGKQFHPECFCCTYCGKMFGNNPFFLEDALPYCETDWNELFTTKCFACGFPIEAGDRWVEALSNNYHSQCFNCTMCKKNLEGQSFFAKGGRPFCKNHAR